MTAISSRHKRYRVNVDENNFALIRNDPDERSTEFFKKPNKPLFKLDFIEKDCEQLMHFLTVFNAGVRHGKGFRPRINRKKREI